MISPYKSSTILGNILEFSHHKGYLAQDWSILFGDQSGFYSSRVASRIGDGPSEFVIDTGCSIHDKSSMLINIELQCISAGEIHDLLPLRTCHRCDFHHNNLFLILGFFSTKSFIFNHVQAFQYLK